MLLTTKIKLMKATNHVLPVLFFVAAVVAGAVLNDYFQIEPSVSETACIETHLSLNPNISEIVCGTVTSL